MDIGVLMFPTDLAIDPVSLGKAVEERGFESLWLPEHSHIPSARTTPWGGREGAPPLPEMYWRTYDQFLALAAIAAVTDTIKLATGITLVAQRDPIWLAKQVASLDNLSEGRFILGVGYGWNKEELEDHGVAYTDRRAYLRESVLSMKELWTKEEASFSGEHIQFPPSWSWPKPVQSPHPKIVLGGGAGPKTFAHIAEFCDGWMPLYGRHSFADKLTDLRRACEDIGRDPAEIEIGLFSAPAKQDVLDELEGLGVSRAVLNLPAESAEETLARLDRYQDLQ
jgi:probable F420-dependent oxidoreductase